MAVKTNEELMEQLKTKLGEDTSDDALSLMTDLRDTLQDRSAGEDWHQKYDQLDSDWRKKYRDAFFNGTGGGDKEPEDEVKPLTFDALFK